MWDLIAYRVLNKPHHRTGDKWRIYPTYDYTHCLCDSFEHISHSLCTTEFETSRVSYDWLLEKLGMVDPKPEQREYGRLNMDGTITSKRKINELVSKKIVRAWDDPRLYTLLALRRRGIPPGAILSFVNGLGVSKNLTSINVVVFDNSVRKYLEMTAPRLMLVLDPVLVILDNVPDGYLKLVELSFGPKDVDMGKHVVPFTKSIYIEREDFREEGSDLFYRLSPGKMVALLNGTSKPFVIKATSFKKEESGRITEIHAELMKPEEVTKKSYKASIHWVGKSAEHHSPIELAEVRLFNPLFKSKDPNSAEGGYLADIREGSEEIYPNAMIEIGLEEIRKRAPWPAEAGEKGRLDDEEGEEKADPIKPAPETVRFQGMRNAYFCLDSDTVDDKIILNRIVSLKEDKGKDA
jgi:glutaminyl-tRNA synthetase